MKRKFWNWIKNEDESVPDMERTLFLNGMISDETWYGDEVTPQLFKDELNAGNGNITVWINSMLQIHGYHPRSGIPFLS